ncbi:hypothetical protein TNCV_4034801 [Trichonephila clavipes]|nr:hypothetical protein TNCV_4034801 [Trichonephila clavipes]
MVSGAQKLDTSSMESGHGQETCGQPKPPMYGTHYCSMSNGQCEGRKSTEDDQRSCRTVTVSTAETVTKINQIVRADRRMSIRMIAEAVNTDKETNKKSKDVQIKIIRGNVDRFFPDINGIVMIGWVPERGGSEVWFLPESVARVAGSWGTGDQEASTRCQS